MKVKDVLRDLGPTTLVQIYKPSAGGYEACFNNTCHTLSIFDAQYISFFGKYFDKDISHVEYSHHYTTEEMIASCNIYLKAEHAIREEKPITINYADLEKKWSIFREEMMITDDLEVKAWLVSSFLHRLSEGTLIEMEDKDLS